MIEHCCLSGGADGADLEWANCCHVLGIPIIHFSFAGHKCNALFGEIIHLNKNQLDVADSACMKANLYLKRTYPPANPYAKKLLQRNYYQIVESESVYAVSIIKKDMVQGGTAWAVAMFLEKFSFEPCPCYVFCQESAYWYEWTGQWQRIYSPPKPNGIFAGIGSRKLDLIGRLAIRTVMEILPTR